MMAATDFGRRKFLTNSIHLAIFSSVAITPMIATAAKIGAWIDEDHVLTIFKHEFLGFNGALIDPVTGMYMLGNGYRQYNPRIKRFLAPDSLSPFGQAGINMYAYCHGDPVNKFDPTGHLDMAKLFVGIFTAVVGIAAAIGAPFSGGTSIAIGASIISGILGAVGGAFSIAATALEDTKPEMALRFDYVAMAFGIASTAVAVGGAFSGAMQGLRSVNNRWKVTYKLKAGNYLKRSSAVLEKAMKDQSRITGISEHARLYEMGAEAMHITQTTGSRTACTLETLREMKEWYTPLSKSFPGRFSWKVEHAAAKGFKSNPFHFTKKVIGGLIKKDTGANLGLGIANTVMKSVSISTKLAELHQTETSANTGVLAATLSKTRKVGFDIINTPNNSTQNNSGMDANIRDGIFA